MPGLTNIFGGDTDQSSNDTNADGGIVGDVGSVVGLDVASDQTSYNQDDDGNTSYNTNSNDLGLDADTDGLLGAVGDVMSSSDQSDN